MRFLLSLAASALATNYSKEPRNVTLKIESNDTRFNDKGLASVDFGDRIRGVLISNDLWVYEEISRNDGIYDFIEGFPLVLCQYFDQIVFRYGIYQNNMTYVRGDYLTYRELDNTFYACKSLPYDPLNYTSRGYYGVQAFLESAPDDCTPIKIRVL